MSVITNGEWQRKLGFLADLTKYTGMQGDIGLTWDAYKNLKYLKQNIYFRNSHCKRISFIFVLSDKT